MSTARERILQRFHTALGNGSPAGPDQPGPQVNGAVARTYRQRDEVRSARTSSRASSNASPSTKPTCGGSMTRNFWERRLPPPWQYAVRQRLVVPADLPAAWLPTTITLLGDACDLSYETLDSSQGVLTGLRAALPKPAQLCSIMVHCREDGRFH